MNEFSNLNGYGVKDATARKQIEELTSDFVHNYNWLFIGDSYTITPSESDNWANAVVSLMGLNSDEYEIQRKDGGGFGNGAFLSALNSATVKENKPTIIVVCGGFNDSTFYKNGGTWADLINAMTTFYNTAITKFGSKTRIKIGFISYQTYTISTERDNLSTLELALASYKMASYFKMEYLNGVEYALRNMVNLDETGFHPTSQGVKDLSYAIYNSILTGFSVIKDYKQNVTTFLTPSSGSIAGGTMYHLSTGDISTLHINSLYIEGMTAFSLPAANPVTIAELDATKGLFFGTPIVNGIALCSFAVDGVLLHKMCQVTFIANKLNITCNERIDNVTAVKIYNFSHSFPSSYGFLLPS